MENISQIILGIVLAIIGSMLSIVGTICVIQFKGIRTDLRGMAKSVSELSERIGIIVKDQEWHKEEIDELKARVNGLES